jgi:hypothetical protein
MSIAFQYWYLMQGEGLPAGAIAYKNRVEADGGTTTSLGCVPNEIWARYSDSPAAIDIVQLYLDRVAADGGTALLSKAEIEALLPPDWQNASFLNIPSSRKAGTLYSIIGSDLTTTRASTANEFTSGGVFADKAVNVPRITFAGGQTGYLSEKESTNLVTYSERFASYEAIRATKSDLGAALYSTGSLALFTSTAHAALFGRYISVTSGVTQTWSALVDVSQGNFAQIFGGNNGEKLSINLTTGATVGSQTLPGVGRSVQIIGNYYWVSITFTAVTTGSHFWAVSNAAGSSTAIGETVAMGYFQIESGTSATSYIKTEASTVTRSKDLAKLTGAGAQIGEVDSTVLVKFNASNLGELRTALTIDGVEGSLKFQKLVNNDISVILLNGATTVFSIVISGSLTGLQKLAVAYSNAGYISSLNGATGASGTLGDTQPPLTDITLGADSDNTLHWNDTIATVALWKGAKDQTQINEMTA